MALNFAHYDGREQAFVKHTFLNEYLPRLMGTVCSWCDEFVYVDGFAGPWKSAAGEDFDDTSFGIALKHMANVRETYQGKGRNVKMRAFLVEKDAKPFAQLQQATSRFPLIEIMPLKGLMESHVASIASSIPSKAFSFTLIDPKGFPELDKILPLLKRQNSEALVNFMFDFASRFAGTNLIPNLEKWLSGFGNHDWQQHVDGTSSTERGQKLTRLAAEALRSSGGYTFSPVISVDKVLHDRKLYELIFLSRHLKGLEVFRQSEEKTLVAQAEVRAAAKAKKKSDDSLMSDLFPDEAAEIAHDRSSKALKHGRDQATDRLIECVKAAGADGTTWRTLWPPILQGCSVTRSWLGHRVNGFRKSGQITAPRWPSERTQIPPEDQILIWAE
jgi:three-Cys-motif partner protein